MAKIVGIKFKHSGKIYYFDPADVFYKKDSGVIVETARGVEYGRVIIEPKEVPDSEIVQPLKPVMRKATKDDELRVIKNEEKVPSALKLANEKIVARELKMKLIDAEFTFDNSKVIFYFTAPNRIDFRELVKDLASAFHIRIELRQVGIRDETRILGGIAPCGRVCCCASCMPDFGKVTIKMAKNQGLSLNPAKISGLCGRLMCCLEYENDYYASVYKKMPKLGGAVKTPEGDGVVVSNDMLKLISKVKITAKDGTETYKDFPVDRLEFKKNNNGGNKKDADDETDDIDSEEMKKLLD